RYFPSKRELFLAAADRVMRMMMARIEASIKGIEDPLQLIAAAIRAYLSFFAEHPEFVELLMQERAQFKDRKKPTYFLHRERNVEQWRPHYRRLIAEGRVRKMPGEAITDVMGDLVYWSMFTHYFPGQRQPLEGQAQGLF